MRHTKVFVASCKPLTYDGKGRAVYVFCSAYTRALAVNQWEEEVESFLKTHEIDEHLAETLRRIYTKPHEWKQGKFVRVEDVKEPVWDLVWLPPFEALLIYSKNEKWS